jgi:hypothetical protein
MLFEEILPHLRKGGKATTYDHYGEAFYGYNFYITIGKYRDKDALLLWTDAPREKIHADTVVQDGDFHAVLCHSLGAIPIACDSWELYEENN